MSVVVAYLRFSSLQMQGNGASISRQKDMVTKWADEREKNTGEHSEIVYYIDRGKSAFDGTNINDGNLGRLIEEVNNHVYPKGTTIVVESLDRLTRQGIQHVQFVLDSLTKTGCIVYTLADRQTISSNTLNELGGVVTICAIAARARDESSNKSRRVSDSKVRNHKLAQEGKKIVTKNLPGWIDIAPDTGKMVLNEGKRKLIEDIFNQRLNGHSFQLIANNLNDANVPVLNERKGAAHWLPNSVRHLLRNRALIGYLPASKVNKELDEIPGYFPICITQALFDDVQRTNVPAQKGVKLSKPKPTYPESVYLLKKLVVCKYCHGNVFPNGAKEGYLGRLRCMGLHTKTCKAPAISRYEVEHSLVTKLFPMLKHMKPSTSNPVAEIEANIRENERRAGNIRLSLEDAYDKAQKQRLDELVKGIETLKQRLVTVRRSMELSVEDSMSHLDFNSYTDRLTMHRIITRNIQQIVIDTASRTLDIHLLNGNTWSGYSLEPHPVYPDEAEMYDRNRLKQMADDELGLITGIAGMMHHPE